MNFPFVNYLKKNFDETAILACLASLAHDKEFVITDENYSIVAALQRSATRYQDLTIDEIGADLAQYDDEQIVGIVNNIKGITHELEFVKIENEDGDDLFASLYPDTNHQGYDAQIVDQSTGEFHDIQLKATDDKSYVEEWISEHPDGEIVVTEELASEMGLEGSGIENEQLTTNVEEFIDKLIEHENAETLTDYFPFLTVASVSVVTWGLLNRYKSGQITKTKFKSLLATLLGKKIAKIGVIIFLMTIPVVNVVVGAGLVAKLIFSARELASNKFDF
jgi:hypothetical protein